MFLPNYKSLVAATAMLVPVQAPAQNAPSSNPASALSTVITNPDNARCLLSAATGQPSNALNIEQLHKDGNNVVYRTNTTMDGEPVTAIFSSTLTKSTDPGVTVIANKKADKQPAMQVIRSKIAPDKDGKIAAMYRTPAKANGAMGDGVKVTASLNEVTVARGSSPEAATQKRATQIALAALRCGQ